MDICNVNIAKKRCQPQTSSATKRPRSLNTNNSLNASSVDLDKNDFPDNTTDNSGTSNTNTLNSSVPSGDGEILELKQTLSHLRAMYDNMFGDKDTGEDHENPQGEVTPKTPSRLTSQPGLSDTQSEEDKLPDITYKRKESKWIETPFTSTTSAYLPPTRNVSFKVDDLHSSSKKGRLPITKSISMADGSNRPWVIIRRYGMRGGKKIRLPSSLEELLQVAGEKFGITAVCIREVVTEAEIEDIRAIEGQSVLWVMTDTDELLFQ